MVTTESAEISRRQFLAAGGFAAATACLLPTALFAQYHSGYAIAFYILFCAIVSFMAAWMLKDYTNKDISEEYDKPEPSGLSARPAE